MKWSLFETTFELTSSVCYQVFRYIIPPKLVTKHSARRTQLMPSPPYYQNRQLHQFQSHADSENRTNLLEILFRLLL